MHIITSYKALWQLLKHEIDLVIYTNKSFHIEKNKFDKNNRKKEIFPDLTNIYLEFMSRNILCKAN